VAKREPARIDGDVQAAVSLRHLPKPDRVRVILTVGAQTPHLERIDMVRIDAAHGTLQEMTAQRQSYGCPAMLDIPGMDTRDRTSVLTATELLIFAASERFEWVSLRGLDTSEPLDYARDLLDPSVKLAATVAAPRVSERSLREICEAADCLILSREDLVRSVGARAVRECVQLGILEAANFGKPCLLATGLLHGGPLSDLELSGLAALAQDGCAGFIVGMGTAAAGVEPAQASIDSLQLALCSTPHWPGMGRGAARIDGPVLLVP
jgi:hypothetical protein